MTPTYALIGDGRLATSLHAYLTETAAQIDHWSRRREAIGACGTVEDMVAGTSTVLIAIRDDAIVPWAEENASSLSGKTLVHFSGALVAPGMTGMHPLYAFPPEAVPVDIMRTIPFVCDEAGAAFGAVFPYLPNPTYTIAAEDRPLYHALAVLSGNLATFLWNEVAAVMDQRLELDPVVMMKPYLMALMRNFESSPFDSLTGPVKRRDMQTINHNLDALRDQPRLKVLYEAFLEAALVTGTEDA
ncbi:DUF2520 domain-containing protein [Parvularcula sp. LCG005]|uniref:DUF2520 domain-containing protein n=1 Tax=Parvularcula sp. LCG005 TaxID=3078805 RepID=UPI0029423E2B|nr:DUF2520 domain-containing protein [Parvularcula sp. LCG005]WOI53797.1 DUF2520 domain-containing protein [Parvularcula sp. LCG005]